MCALLCSCSDQDVKKDCACSPSCMSAPPLSQQPLTEVQAYMLLYKCLHADISPSRCIAHRLHLCFARQWLESLLDPVINQYVCRAGAMSCVLPVYLLAVMCCSCMQLRALLPSSEGFHQPFTGASPPMLLPFWHTRLSDKLCSNLLQALLCSQG